MKVAIVTRIDAGLYWGGGEIQAERTLEALRGLGLDASYYDPNARSGGFDLYHFFGNFDYYDDVAGHLRDSGVPYVVSPIFVSPRTPERLKFRRTRQTLLGQYPKRSLDLLRGAKRLFTLTGREEANLRAYFGDGLPAFDRVPNGVEARFATADPGLFRSHFGIEEPFVLIAATIDASKNQLNLIRAIGDRHSLVIAGRENDAEYVARCKAEAGSNVHFVGQLPHDSELFASAMAAAHAFCLPSRRELFPLSALEATVAGCNLVLSNRWNGEEIWGGDAQFVDPDAIEALGQAIDQAMADDLPGSSRTATYLTKYSWEAVARQLAAAYERCVVSSQDA